LNIEKATMKKVLNQALIFGENSILIDFNKYFLPWIWY